MYPIINVWFMNESFFLSSQNWSEWFINQVDTVIDFNSMHIWCSYNKANEKKNSSQKFSFNKFNGEVSKQQHALIWMERLELLSV